MFRFLPAIYKQQQLIELPRPIPLLKIQESWDIERFKVPLADGDHMVGWSRNGVDITLHGQIGSVAGELQLSEEAMFTALERLRTALHVGDAAEMFWFFLYADAASGTYRHFRQCATLKFDYDLSNEHLFTYNAIVHAGDATLYHTGPA